MHPTSLFSRLNPPVATSIVRARRGFSLVELLVVIAIIAIVIALVVPALSGGRNAARKAATDGIIKQISNAAASFGRDNNGRTPGYFTPKEMGSTENEGPGGRGMSMAENVMLDLMGFQTGGTSPVDVGPTAANVLRLDPALLGVPGVDGKQYYVPDKKYFVPQVSMLSQMGMAPHAAGEDDPRQLPDVVDAFGQPLLIWVEDDTYITKPSGASYAFGRRFSGTGANQGAKQYWATNSCFLTALRLGKMGKTQGLDSLLGDPNTVAASLAGVLGNPNAPYRDPQNLAAIPTIPQASRAPFVVQSAGIDGVFLGRGDKGAKQFGVPLQAGIVHYQVNFATSTGVGYLDKNGKPTNHDVLADFDDLFAFGGN